MQQNGESILSFLSDEFHRERCWATPKKQMQARKKESIMQRFSTHFLTQFFPIDGEATGEALMTMINIVCSFLLYAPFKLLAFMRFSISVEVLLCLMGPHGEKPLIKHCASQIA